MLPAGIDYTIYLWEVAIISGIVASAVYYIGRVFLQVYGTQIRKKFQCSYFLHLYCLEYECPDFVILSCWREGCDQLFHVDAKDWNGEPGKEWKSMKEWYQRRFGSLDK